MSAITSREYMVLDLYAQGYVGKEIGLLLGITEQTVKNHLANVYAKLDVDNGRKAMWKLGWVTPRVARSTAAHGGSR